MLRKIVAVCLVCCASNAFAYFWDGNRLVSEMREFEKAERSDPTTAYQAAAYYQGFVIGVHDSISSKLCASGNVSVRQVTTVVANYLNNNPAEWSAPAHQLVEKALRRAFPCR
jgi:hypothetical protein